MGIKIFLGANVLTVWMFCLSAAVLVLLNFATVLSVFYHRIIYDFFKRPGFDPSYKPRSCIIIPCKGEPKDLKKNLESFLMLDYPDYEVIYSVESEDDPAVPIIKEVINQDPGRASLVVAGLSKSCAQKNYNQLAAIKTAKSPDVYVFADADIGPVNDWLDELILPLSNSKVTATTGFRWQYSKNGTVGEQVHSYLNNVLYVFFNFSAAVLNVGLWGGSMAIRREDFEKLSVAERWGETAVDDMSLSQVLMKFSKKAILVPSCITVTDDALQTVRQSISWFKRQVMFLKGYHFFTWIFLAVPLASFLLFLYVWLVISAIASRFSINSFMAMGGGASLLFVAGSMLSAVFFPLLGKNPRFVGFLILQPFSFFSMLFSIIETVFTNTITWSGVKYKMALNGKVSSVKRSPI